MDRTWMFEMSALLRIRGLARSKAWLRHRRVFPAESQFQGFPTTPDSLIEVSRQQSLPGRPR